MAGDDPVAAVRECAGLIRHFHVSAPWLGPVEDQLGGQGTGPDGESATIDHARIAAALRSLGYTGFVSIEMRRTETPLLSVPRAVEFVRSHYG